MKWGVLVGWIMSDEPQTKTLAELVEAARGVSGVKFDKRSGRYTARLRVDGKDKHLGSFDTVAEASAAYRSARAEYNQRRADDREAKATTTVDANGERIETEPAKRPRRVGLRRQYMGCFYSAPLGKYVAKYLTAPDEFEMIGTFDTLEEADDAHAEYWRLRQAAAPDKEAQTPEEAIIAGCNRYRDTKRMDLNTFRWKLIINSPHAIDLATPFDQYIWDEMLQTRAGFQIGMTGGPPLILFRAPLPAVA